MYFQDRKRVFEFIRTHKDEINFRVADRVTEQKFIFDQPWDMEKCHEEICFPKKIDWTYKHNNDREWMWMLSRQNYYLPLMQAYVATGEQKYLQAVFCQIKDWIDTQSDPEGKAYTTWRTLDVGLRLKNWVKILEYVENTGDISEGLWKKIERSMHAQTEYLMNSWKPSYALTNWRVLEFHGTFLASVYFSEWDEAEEWIRRSVEILDHCIRLQVTNDGFHWEQSYMYHVEMLKCMAEVIWIADHKGIRIPKSSREITKKMADAMVHMRTPMGTQLCYGDSDIEDVAELLGGMYLIFRDETYKYFAPEEPTLDLVCDYGVEAIDCWKAIEGKAPGQMDYEHGDVGNYFARTGWGEDDSYLFFKNGFIGSGHGHCDLLHMEIISKGVPILTDSGRYTYRADTPERQRFKAAKAHNTFLVDEKEFIIQDGSWDNTKLATTIKRPVLLNQEVCYLQGAHLGYMNDGVFVNRKIIYIKPNIWIITDESFTRMEHSYQQYFHFASGSVIADGREILYADEKQVFRMRVMQKSEIRLEETEISPGYNTKYPSKCAVVTTRAKGDASMTVICIAEQVRKQYKIEAIPVKDMFGNVTPIEYVHGWKITKKDEEWIIIMNHKEEDNPRRQIYLVEDLSVYARTVVFHRKGGEVTSHILEY